MSELKRKRVELVKIKICRDQSILYRPRKISCPSDVVELAKYFIGDSDREKFIVITLDTKNQPNAIDVCSVGTINSSIVHPREVFKLAIASNAASIIVAHNHPSGITDPSKEDTNITQRLNEASKLLGINFIDHLIIGGENYYSFKEQMLLD